MTTEAREQAREIWSRLEALAEEWKLEAPQLSIHWDLMPESFKTTDSQVVTRPRFEAPSTASDWKNLLRRLSLSESQHPQLEQLEALSQVHDGSFLKILPGNCTLLPLQLIAAIWEENRRIDEEVSDDDSEPELDAAGTHWEVVFHERWLPIGDFDDGHYLMLDLAPGPNGAPGQILFPTSECEFTVVGASLFDFLRRWLAVLDTGQAQFDPASNGVRAKSEWDELLRSISPSD